MDEGKNKLEVSIIVDVVQDVFELLENTEAQISENGIAKESKNLKLLKEKCCSQNITTSLTAFGGIISLVEKKILTPSQTITSLISLLPSVVHYNVLVSAIGKLLVLDLLEKALEKKPVGQWHVKSQNVQHPYIIILKHNGSKSWFGVYSFICNLMEHNNIEIEHKMELMKPVFHYVFYNLEWSESQFQISLFHCLISNLKMTQYLNFALEILTWKKIDINYCLFLKELLAKLLNVKNLQFQLIISALTPCLAETVKWLIQNGHDPVLWFQLLNAAIQCNNTALSFVLYTMTDVILQIPPPYIIHVANICKSIICSNSCNRYVACKFMAAALIWFTKPSTLPYSTLKILEEIFVYIEINKHDWNDQTDRLLNNKYYRKIKDAQTNIKLAMHLLSLSNLWNDRPQELLNWLANLKSSNESKTLLKIHSFICGILLCETDARVIEISLEILCQVLSNNKSECLMQLCTLFYKMAREKNPKLQKTYLFYLPKLAVNRDNVPLIMGIIESLKKGEQKIMYPLVIQLLLLLWKIDSRTYSYLHKILHENSGSTSINSDINLSKAVAMREVCRLAAHSHGKDVIRVLSRILNDSVDHPTGLPSAIAIEAIIELCKAYVTDVSGTWNAVRPLLSRDSRPKVVVTICKFFGEIPELLGTETKCDELTEEVVSMLWNYTFSENTEIVKHAYRALSRFEIEDFEVTLLPEPYRLDTVLTKEQKKSSEQDTIGTHRDVSPEAIQPQCWLRLLEKIDERNLSEGGRLLTAIIERELTRLPRNLFHWPPEKPEPLNYSYLPQKSVCRVLMEVLIKISKTKNSRLPAHAPEIWHILSRNYSKLLPPLDWHFVSFYMDSHSNCLFFILSILVKQGSVSKSARNVLEGYLLAINWNTEKIEELVYLLEKLPELSKAVSIQIHQNFLKQIFALCLKVFLERNDDCFEKILLIVTRLLKNEKIDCHHETLLANIAGKALLKIPSGHKIMSTYAECVGHFSPKSIDKFFNDLSKETEPDQLRKIIMIRQSIASRPHENDPLNWFDDMIEVAKKIPEMQEFLLDGFVKTLRAKRNCNYTPWLQKLLTKIQFYGSPSQLDEVLLFLIDLYINVFITVSGYDTFIFDVKNFADYRKQNVELLPVAFGSHSSHSECNSLHAKMLWFQKLLMWNHLPPLYAKAFAECILLYGNLKEFNISYLANVVTTCSE